MSFICEFCKHSFANRHSLKKHQKSARYCLALQNKDTYFACEHCNKTFSEETDLTKHYERCKVRFESILTENKKQAELIVELKSQLYSQQSDVISELKSQITTLQNKLENVAIQAATKPTITTTTNNINTVIQNLQPITQEILESNVDKLTLDHIKKGPKGYAEYALQYPLKDKIVCVDYARRKIKYKDNQGKIITDPEMNKLSKQFFQVINSHNTQLINEYLTMLISQKGYPAQLASDMTDYLIMVRQGAVGQKTNLHNEFVKNVCGGTLQTIDQVE